MNGHENDAAVCAHDWQREHHYGDAPGGGLVHYCPTGFDYCTLCPAIRRTPPGEKECWKWNEA